VAHSLVLEMELVQEKHYMLSMFIQRCQDITVDIFACFIDYQKAFNMVQHEKLIEVLNFTDIDKKDIRIISKLYWNQVAEVRVDGTVLDTVAVKGNKILY